ncbi:hypothetical protein PIB30_036608 [Stylosanthes scabra]|uniref:Protein kinase domain-containing protein n=1 Tax=Stylosanthes scabra TaxID=79078 RepID=A0ABU6RDI2_9FABA|nr:hypothetical protein [Stylosanthes scabra]
MGMAEATLKSKSLPGYATFFFSFLITCVCVLSNNSYHHDIFEQEAAYMLKLRKALHNLPSNWFDNNTAICDWIGVQCSYGDISSTNYRYVQGIHLPSKGLTRKIPLGLNKAFLALNYLNLGNNSLSGPFPSLANLSTLQTAFLSANNFTSVSPGCFQGLDHLEVFNMRMNTNLPPWTFPTDLTRFSSHLYYLDLSDTNLMGSLPTDIFGPFPILTNLYLSGNHLTGLLPKSFAKLARLKSLDLSNQNNKFSGTIQFLSSLPELFDVNLAGNSFEGPIPDLSSCVNLEELVLANNRLTGVVPPLDNNKLLTVSLENNSLQGPLPLFNKTRTPWVSLGGNGFYLNYSGPCDHRVTTLLQVAEAFRYPFRLAQSWRGNNPCQGWDFITCDNNSKIRTVNLTYMNLTGTISPAFSNLKDLYELYLGGNKLSGSIPMSLTSLQHLKILDVSSNNLSGSLPPFSNKIKLIKAGNAFLRQPHSQAKLSPPSILGISMVGVGVIVIFIAIVYDHRRCFHLLQRMIRKKEKSSDEQELEELLKYYGTSTPIRYTYEEVKQMTNSFREKLGQGGYGTVYKASLVDGRQLAVKVLKESKGSVEEFVNEVVTISRTFM